MRTVMVVTVAVAALAFAASAFAKGADYALISGPGISGSIRIDGDGEGGTGTLLGALATYGGFATQVFGWRTTASSTPSPRRAAADPSRPISIRLLRGAR